MNPDITLDPALVELMRSAPPVDDLVDAILDGFTVELASEVLGSEERLGEFLRLAVAVAPGDGWVRASFQPGDEGRLNRDLLQRAYAERSASSGNALRLVRDGEGAAVMPAWFEGAGNEMLATVDLADGASVSWHAADLSLAPLLRAPESELPHLCAEFHGPEAWPALQKERSFTPDPAEAEAHRLGRLGIALWLDLHHPGTDPDQAPFDEDLLRLEAGIVAHAAADLVGGGPAESLLDGTIPAIATALRLSREWTGWRAGLARDVAIAGIRALQDVHPLQLPEVLALAAGGVEPDDGDLSLLVGPSVARPVVPALALAAGGDESGAVASPGRALLDPLAVPPRSVAAGPDAIRWTVTDGELAVVVDAGDQPVEALAADVRSGDHSWTMPLEREDAGYFGSLRLPPGVDDVEVLVRGTDQVASSRTRDEIVAGTRLVRDTLTARRRLARSLLQEGFDLAEFPDRPFLAEVLTWETKEDLPAE